MELSGFTRVDETAGSGEPMIHTAPRWLSGHLGIPRLSLPLPREETDVIISLHNVCLNDVRAPSSSIRSCEENNMARYSSRCPAPPTHRDTDDVGQYVLMARGGAAVWSVSGDGDDRTYGENRTTKTRGTSDDTTTATGSWDQSILVLDDQTHMHVYGSCNFCGPPTCPKNRNISHRKSTTQDLMHEIYFYY